MQCYKAVPVLMDKQLRKASGGERMNIMYAVSKVLRQAKKELKAKSKYGEQQGPAAGARAKSSSSSRGQNQQQQTAHHWTSWQGPSVVRWFCTPPACTPCWVQHLAVDVDISAHRAAAQLQALHHSPSPLSFFCCCCASCCCCVLCPVQGSASRRCCLACVPASRSSSRSSRST